MARLFFKHAVMKRLIPYLRELKLFDTKYDHAGILRRAPFCQEYELALFVPEVMNNLRNSPFIEKPLWIPPLMALEERFEHLKGKMPRWRTLEDNALIRTVAQRWEYLNTYLPEELRR